MNKKVLIDQREHGVNEYGEKWMWVTVYDENRDVITEERYITMNASNEWLLDETNNTESSLYELCGEDDDICTDVLAEVWENGYAFYVIG